MKKKVQYHPEKAKLLDIIIVSKEQTVQTSLQNLLHGERYRINYFTSGLLALEFLGQNNVNVIISGMGMPEIGGIDFLERSMEMCPEATRIVISGYEDKSVIMDAISRGIAQHYVMKPWDDEQLHELIRESVKLQKDLRKKHLLGLLHSFRHVPSPPKLHTKLKNYLLDENQHQRKIALEIEKSPALVAKLINISNSVFYSARRPISSVLEALSFIGTETVLNIILGLELFDSISVHAIPTAVEQIEDIRNKSVYRAQIAREISLLWKKEMDPQEAYVAGLMPDIGLVLRFCSAPEKFDKFMAMHRKKLNPIYYVDKEVYSVTHDEISAALLTYWNFAEPVISAVANHHRYSEGDDLTTIVQIADALVQEKDSLPHDPSIDKLVPEWDEKLHHIFNTTIIR